MVRLVLADFALPLLGPAVLYVYLGGLIIGLGEAWLLKRFFGANRRLVRLKIIGGNYVSAVAGFILQFPIYLWVDKYVFGGASLYQIRAEFAVMVGLSLAMSILIEWPFVASVLPQWTGFGRATWATVVAQLASYAVLLPAYAMAAAFDIITVVKPDPALSFVPPMPTVRVYYLNCECDKLLSVGLDGKDRRSEVDLSSSFPTRSLSARPLSGDRWELYGGSASEPLAVFSGVPSRPRYANLPEYMAEYNTDYLSSDLHDQCGVRVDSAREGAPGRATIWTGGQALQLGFETFYDTWNFADPTVISDSLIVMSVQSTMTDACPQIIVVDARSRRIGVIARGSSPFVVQTPMSAPIQGDDSP